MVGLSTECAPHSSQTWRENVQPLDVLARCVVEDWSTGRLNQAQSYSRVGIDPKHRCHPCTMLKERSVCITRQCRVVFTHNCESACLSAPCLNWFEVRHGHAPCTKGYISINDWPRSECMLATLAKVLLWLCNLEYGAIQLLVYILETMAIETGRRAAVCYGSHAA